MAIPKVLQQTRSALLKSGGTMTGALTLSGAPTSNNHATTKTYVDNALDGAGGAFYAAYGTTTNAEIKAAYDAGKTVLCAYDTRVYRLYTIPTGSNTIYFTSEYDYNGENDRVRYVYVSTSNSWSNSYSTDSSFSNAKYYSGETTITASDGYYRPIRVSTSAPTSSDGNVGDIWIQYST